MSSPHDNDSSHPLEQVTGEKDVHPEEEEEEQRAGSAGAQDDGSDAGEVDTSAEREQR